MAPTHRLTVYERAGCHLCDDMVATLSEWKEALGFEIERIDVDRSPELAARYGAKVPVLVRGSHEICHFFLDLDALRRRLEMERHDGTTAGNGITADALCRRPERE